MLQKTILLAACGVLAVGQLSGCAWKDGTMVPEAEMQSLDLEPHIGAFEDRHPRADVMEQPA